MGTKSAISPIKAAGYLAFMELDEALSGRKVSIPPGFLNNLPEKAALFVTWSKSERLRGCIGTFKELPLREGIESYALIAALKDPRFSPIKASELPKLTVSVTLLGKMESCKDVYDWTIGKHGVQATFPSGRSSTYLPEIAVEQGWSKDDTIESLADKAGESSTDGIKLSRYTGEKDSVTYAEYASFKQSLM